MKQAKIKLDNNPSGHFKNYYAYCKVIGKISGKPAIFIYLYRKLWKHAMWRIKVNVFYINFLKLFGYDITRPNRITEKH